MASNILDCSASSVKSPKTMLRRLELIKGIMFPGEMTNSQRMSMSAQRWGNRRLNKQRLPPLEDNDYNPTEVRMSTFYQQPIGEENFQIRHMDVEPSKIPVSSSVDDRLVLKTPSANQVSRAQPLDRRFVRKVLFNHERTQRKLDSSSKQAGSVYSATKRVINDVRKSIEDWDDAHEHLDIVVREKFEQEFFNAPSVV